MKHRQLCDGVVLSKLEPAFSHVGILGSASRVANVYITIRHPCLLQNVGIDGIDISTCTERWIDGWIAYSLICSPWPETETISRTSPFTVNWARWPPCRTLVNKGGTRRDDLRDAHGQASQPSWIPQPDRFRLLNGEFDGLFLDSRNVIESS